MHSSGTFPKKILTFLMTTFLVVAGNLPAYAYNREKLLDAFHSIVMVRGYLANGKMAYGSGVIVAPNKILTNCHIFRESPAPWVSRGEDSYPIISYQADRYHDLCLVTTENLSLKVATIGSVRQLNKGAGLPLE